MVDFWIESLTGIVLFLTVSIMAHIYRRQIRIEDELRDIRQHTYSKEETVEHIHLRTDPLKETLMEVHMDVKDMKRMMMEKR